MESQVLRRLDFPAYCIRLLDNGLLAITGGGGTSKTGVGNSIELGFLDYSNKPTTGTYEAEFRLLHKFETNDAIMKFVTFKFHKNNNHNSKKSLNEETSQVNDLYLAGALDNSIEIYKIEPCVEKPDQYSNDSKSAEMSYKASASIKKVTHIDFQTTNSETIVSLQICQMKKSKKYENCALICAGTSKGSIIVWNIFHSDKNNNQSSLVFERVHEFKQAHDSTDVDGLEINTINNGKSFEHHLLSIGKDSKCYLWSLDKLEKICELLYTKDKNLRMKHARFTANYLYTTYVPRIRGGTKDLSSFVQRWSMVIPHSTDEKNKKSTKYTTYKPGSICCVKNTILTSVQASKDGYLVCLGDCDGKIYLFDSEFNRLENYKRQHSSVITDLVFYHDEFLSAESKVLDLNKLIVSISIDRTLQLYKYICTSTNDTNRFLSNLDSKSQLKKRAVSSSGLLACCFSMNLFKFGIFIIFLAILFSFLFVYVE
jgi:hypothetical protein